MASKALELSKAFGMLYEEEVKALQVAALLLEAAAPVIINIGSGFGTSGLALREARPNATIYTIDISTGGPLGGLENERNAFHGTGLPLPMQILGDSLAVGKNWEKGNADMIFIDDNHMEAHLMLEIPLWLPYVVDGGIMAFHDYEAGVWPGVKKAVDFYMAGKEIILHERTVIAFRI